MYRFVVFLIDYPNIFVFVMASQKNPNLNKVRVFSYFEFIIFK
ncbi:hypothetical protein BC670_0802 [Flavobacterium branchiophilum]|uniref:Uncharacterized protein n=1 Tax=Flavobacterium branchiophilum TaxID=55197 RepID=A0A543G1K1_9FLAO|nr:hypothetical protein BC670_0802 [Flavobacterium branchiophilum]